MEMKQEHRPCEGRTSDTLYKIGMFAAMNHVSVKTLRFGCLAIRIRHSYISGLVHIW